MDDDARFKGSDRQAVSLFSRTLLVWAGHFSRQIGVCVCVCEICYFAVNKFYSETVA